jgi:hypothetical protein
MLENGANLRADSIPIPFTNDNEATNLTIYLLIQEDCTKVRPVPSTSVSRYKLSSRRLSPQHHENAPESPELLKVLFFNHFVTYQ